MSKGNRIAVFLARAAASLKLLGPAVFFDMSTMAIVDIVKRDFHAQSV